MTAPVAVPAYSSAAHLSQFPGPFTNQRYADVEGLGRFKWYQNDTTTADNLTVIAPSGGAIGRWMLSQRAPASLDTVALGNVSGDVELDLSLGLTFKATIVGNVSFSFANGPAAPVIIDFTMGGAGGYTLAWSSAGLDVVDPSGFLTPEFSSTAPGARLVGMWSASQTEVYALGFGGTP